MKKQLLRQCLRLAGVVVLSILLTGLAACGAGYFTPMSSSGPAASFAYVTIADVQGQQVPGAVFEFGVASDGSLAPLSTASAPTGVEPVAIASDPGGHYVYVANGGDGTVSQYAVGADGQLSALSPATVSVPGTMVGLTRLTGITVDPSGRFVYVTVTGGDPAPGCTIAQYSIGSDGALAPLAAPTQSLAAFGGPLVIHPSGQFAYLVGITADPESRVSEFSRDAGGVLGPLVPATVPNTLNAASIYVVSSGQAAYVLEDCINVGCEGRVTQYAVGSNGVLSTTGNVAVTADHVNPVAMVTDATGSNAYLLTNLMGVDTNVGAVYQYAIASTGALVPDTPVSLGVTSGAVALATDGHNLYALSANAVGFASGSPTGGNVDHYVIGSGGQLSAAGTLVVSGSRPTAMLLVAGR